MFFICDEKRETAVHDKQREALHGPCWESCVHFFLDKEASSNNPGGLTLFGYFITALNEVLFLKAAFPRPFHPEDPRGLEVEVTPMSGVGFRITNSRDQSKGDTDFPDPVHTKCPLKLERISKSLKERQVKECGRYTTPQL